MAQLFLQCQTLFQKLCKIFGNVVFSGARGFTILVMTTKNNTFDQPLAFIGGGNMASAILGGLIKQGMPANQITVVEPFEATRLKLQQDWGVSVLEHGSEALQQAAVVVWAVKPQSFKEAAQQYQPWVSKALHLSVAAGIPSASIAQWLGTDRIVRAMPNTPALVGLGQTGLYAREAVNTNEKQWIQAILHPTGALSWVTKESLLDAVTAISGSGPAYVFFFIEAMTQAGIDMGLTPEQAQQLSVGTFVGASQLALQSNESPSVLRERVTSKGGTTYAAITSMQESHVDKLFQKALQAAQSRAQELGEAFGK
jgi:pyrroline-5-carboxylate reductase